MSEQDWKKGHHVTAPRNSLFGIHGPEAQHIYYLDTGSSKHPLPAVLIDRIIADHAQAQAAAGLLAALALAREALKKIANPRGGPAGFLMAAEATTTLAAIDDALPPEAGT